MTIGLRDILKLAADTERSPLSATGGPVISVEVRKRQQRLSALIGRAGLFPLPLSTRQSFGVPLTSYFLPRLIAAHRFVQKREDIGLRAGAGLPLLGALVQMEPAVASWEQALFQIEGAGRHGVLLTLQRMSERTDALTVMITERIKGGGPDAARLRIRLSRVLSVQEKWEAAALSRRERTRRNKESGEKALLEAQSELKLLVGADRLAQAGLKLGAGVGSLAEGLAKQGAPAPRRTTERKESTAGLAGLDGLAAFGANVTAEELLQMALEVGTLAQEIGVPRMTEKEGEELVLSIDPLVVVVANLYCLLLPEAPGSTGELAGLHTGDLSAQVATLAELIDLYQEAGRGLRGARDGHLAIASVAQATAGKLVKEVRALVDQAPSAETELLRGDAGDLLRLDAQEREERMTSADRTRKEKAEKAETLLAVDRQTRFLKTVLAMRNREAVSREELEEAIAVYEDIDKARPEARKSKR